MAELSTTSYAILALLGVRSWTTYELAKQMERSLRDVWPRAESVIYEEPKKLVAQGFATASRTYTGRRASTRYSITPVGRRALRAWLGEAGAGPVTEFEGLLKVAFADHGTREQLLGQLESIKTGADRRLAYVADRVREYDETGGPFPERLPVINLVARYHREQAEAVRRWADWAEREVRAWSKTAVRPARARATRPDR